MTLLHNIRDDTNIQRLLGLVTGIVFGFLLDKGGITGYGLVEGQLLLTDFTYAKILMSAIIVGMIGFSLLSYFGLARSRIMAPSLRIHLIGGLVMGVGFALLGFGPGTVAGAAGTGSMDACAGFLGLLFGAGLYAEFVYPCISPWIHKKGGVVTLPEFLGMNRAPVTILLVALIIGFLWLLETKGL